MGFQVSLGYMCICKCVGFLFFFLLLSGTAFHIKSTPVIILKIECLLETLVFIFLIGEELEIKGLS